MMSTALSAARKSQCEDPDAAIAAVDLPSCGPALQEATGSADHQHPWLATCISLAYLVGLITLIFMCGPE